jgi:hypothetical protein
MCNNNVNLVVKCSIADLRAVFAFGVFGIYKREKEKMEFEAEASKLSV